MTDARLTSSDRLEILDLYARYARSFDEADADAYAMTFTSDGLFHRPSSPLLSGRDQLRDLVKERAKQSPGIRHVTTNILLDPDSDHIVLGSAYVIVLRCGEDGLLRLFNAGIYTDEISNKEGPWRFQVRRYVTWLDPSQIDAPFGVSPTS